MTIKDLIQRFRSWQKDPAKYDLTSSDGHICECCGKAYEGFYCPICGQRHDIGRADWSELANDFSSIGGYENHQSGLSFFLQLFGRTGYMIGDYISGRRNICASPLEALALLAVVTALICQLTVNPQTEWILKLAETVGVAGAILTWLSENLNWAILIQTLMLIVPTLLIFQNAPRHAHHTLPDGIYIQIFMGCLVLISVMLRALVGNMALALIPLYYFIAYKQLFGYGFWGTLWRTIVCLGSVMYFFGVLMMVYLRLSKEFWEGVSVLGFIGMICTYLAIGGGILLLGWWIGKKNAKAQ